MVDIEFPNWRQVSKWLETFVVFSVQFSWKSRLTRSTDKFSWDAKSYMTSVNKCHCSAERDGTSMLLCYNGELVKEEDRFKYAGGKEKQLKFSAAGSKSVHQQFGTPLWSWTCKRNGARFRGFSIVCKAGGISEHQTPSSHHLLAHYIIYILVSFRGNYIMSRVNVFLLDIAFSHIDIWWIRFISL